MVLLVAALLTDAVLDDVRGMVCGTCWIIPFTLLPGLGGILLIFGEGTFLLDSTVFGGLVIQPYSEASLKLSDITAT